MLKLRLAHEEKVGWMMGVDAKDGKIKNMLKEGVIEPLEVKIHALISATEVVNSILRIDDVIESGIREDKNPQVP